jgi:hypothetical protein
MPCFLRQALEAARFVSSDPAFHEEIVRSILQDAATLDLAKSPPAVAQQLHRRIRKTSGHTDPYRELKHSFNELALTLLPEIEKQIQNAADPFTTAVRYAIAGNVIDLGAKGSLSQDEVFQSIDRALSDPFVGNVEALHQAVNEAKQILYLTDNAGEIAFDRLLIDQLPIERVTVAVKGHPVLNDAVIEDAIQVGLTERVTVIDNGSDAPGTMLDDCSETFRDLFKAADVIISKGQGNFETLSDADQNIFFLFKVKCPVIANNCGYAVGTQVLLHKQHL